MAVLTHNAAAYRLLGAALASEVAEADRGSQTETEAARAPFLVDVFGYTPLALAALTGAPADNVDAAAQLEKQMEQLVSLKRGSARTGIAAGLARPLNSRVRNASEVARATAITAAAVHLSTAEALKSGGWPDPAFISNKARKALKVKQQYPPLIPGSRANLMYRLLLVWRHRQRLTARAWTLWMQRT
jgi:hypothetical protein